jgi:hypothetical protein
MTSSNDDMPPRQPDENEPLYHPARDVLDFIDEIVGQITDAEIQEHLSKVIDQTGRSERAGMLAGERVRRAATGEDGVVLSAGDGALVQVALASGTVWIHPEELEKLPEGPTEGFRGPTIGT